MNQGFSLENEKKQLRTLYQFPLTIYYLPFTNKVTIISEKICFESLMNQIIIIDGFEFFTAYRQILII